MSGFFFLYLAHHLLYFNTCRKVHFGNWSGLKEKESSSSRKHLDNCLLQHEKQLDVSGSRGRGEAAGGVGQRFVLSVRRERGQREVRREAALWGNKGGERAWPSSALEGGRGGRRRKQSARGKAIVGLLGDHKSNKKSQYNDFSRKVQFRGSKSKAAACNKDSWKCQISPLYFTLLHCGKGAQTWRWTGAQCGHIGTPTHSHKHKHTSYCRILLYWRHV